MRSVAVAIVCGLALAGTAAGPGKEDPTSTTEPASTTTSTFPETTSTTSTSDTTSTTGTTTTTAAPETTTTTVPPPPGCAPGDPHACDAATLACVHAPLDGTPCPDDGIGCTEDRCVSGACEHRAHDVLCDRGKCAVRACRPSDPQADRHGCILVADQSGTDGTPCTDDGFSCTEDVCMDGMCLHMPVDSACVPADACRAAACAPADSGHDDAGCVLSISSA